MVISARRARLEGQQRELQHGNAQDGERVPEAPPHGIAVPTARLHQTTLTIQQLREREYNEKRN
eukprot:1691944-Amphidinium_carterae.1